MMGRYRKKVSFGYSLELIGAYMLAAFWILPLLYAFWAAFHPSEYAIHFDIFAPLTLENFREALDQAPFLRYGFNTFLVVAFLLPLQLLVSTLAAYAFARFNFVGSGIAFSLVLVQLMITPEILIVQNYGTLASLGMVDTIAGIGLPYIASAFCIFLLRQTFKSIPKELEDAAQLEGCGTMGILWRVYVPLAVPTYIAFSLVSVSHHWNNFLWPLIVTNSVETRPLTVGLGIFGAPESGVDWSIVSAATLMSIAPIVDCILVVPTTVCSILHAGGYQMTTILSWNIQNGLGVDDELSLKRISYTIKGICNPDVICLQEVSVNMLLADGSFSDQVSELAADFEGYSPFFGVAMDTWNPGQNGRGQYGNLILSRLPIRSAFSHPLPQPADASQKQMPRQMTEATVEAPSGPLRIMTTHLEFHSQTQRIAQVKRMMDVDADIRLLEKKAPLFVSDTPYARFERASRSLLCGDFNFHSDSGRIRRDHSTKKSGERFSRCLVDSQLRTVLCTDLWHF